MSNSSGMGAGLVLIAVLVGCIALGIAAGAALGSTVAGGFVGGVLGVFVAFRTVYVVHVRPLRERMERTDYSHLEPKLEDDDHDA